MRFARIPVLATTRRNAGHNGMKTSLDHLPEAKQRDLARVLQTLVAEFDAATAFGTAPHKRDGRILMVVLFGSYARGDWVDDPKSGYASDYDLLVVVNQHRLTEVTEFWAKADDELLKAYSVTRKISAPVNFIVHDLADVNQRLRHGAYFFTDILRDGIVLYEAGGVELAKPVPLTQEEALTEARGYFYEWFGSASNYYILAADAFGRGMPKEAAFLFHQATERYYHCVLLVLTLYSPKSHKLNFLRSQVERLAPRLIEAWPRTTRFEVRTFELLRRAYVEARYSENYEITSEELAWLTEKLKIVQILVRDICEKRINEKLA